MANKNWAIEVKIERGQVVVIGLGRTNRGQRFIRAVEPLLVKSISDPNFKAEMAAAVEKLTA